MHLKVVLASCALALLAGTGCTPVGSQQGYEPVQPIAYSHELHAGQFGMDCQYCHFAAEKSRHAGVPPASVCMNCHMVVRGVKEDGKESPEIAKIVAAVYETNTPIPWVKVHRLPDHVFFSHANHVTSGVKCQTCHGPVETMVKVRQVETMTMGWCLDCHRKTIQEQRQVPFDGPRVAAVDPKGPQVVAVVASAGSSVPLPAAPATPAAGPGRALNPPTDCSACHR